VIDTETLSHIATIPVDKSVAALAFAPDGHQLYAAESQYAFNEVTGGVALIDPAAERLQNVIATRGVPGLGVSPDGRTVYAPTSFCCLGGGSPELSVIDTVGQSIRATRPIDGAGRIAITAAGEAVYVISGWFPGRVTAIDTSTLGTLATVNVGISPSDVVIARAPADY
jgi:YVTN family beta-propeller protein